MSAETGARGPATVGRGPVPVLARPSALDAGLLVIAVAAVSTSAPLIREAAAPTLAIAFWRNAFLAGALVPWTTVGHRQEVARLRGMEWRLSALAGVLLAFHFATWIPSLSYTTVASSVALVATQPVWAALIARLRGERIPALVWIGIGIALAGVLTLTGIDVRVSARALGGDGLALAGGMLAAGYVVVGGDVRRTVSTTVYTTVCYAVASVLLLLLCIVSGQTLGGYSARTWWLLVAMAVGPQLLGHSVLNRVLRTTSPTVVSMAILFEIVGATLLAWLFFDEVPPAGTYPAAALIAAGVIVVVRAGRRLSAEVPVE